MGLIDGYTCRNCCWWLGDREGVPGTKADCRRYPGKVNNKDIDDCCGEWKSCTLTRGGHPIDPPEWP
jgi:hypothetical protein